jgi:hypothetical protein
MRPPSELPQHLLSGPFTMAQARSAGLGRRRTRAADLTSPCHGVRAAADLGDGLPERVRALSAITGAVVSHTSAAVLWGFPLPPAVERLLAVHLTTQPGQRAVRRNGVVGHQQALAPGDIIVGRQVKCTSPLRTWFDLAGILSLDELVIAGDFLVRRSNPLTTLSKLDAYLDGMRGRPGYRRALHARALVRANTDSPKETELRLLLLCHGLPEPQINAPIFGQDGRWLQDPDLSYEDEMVAIQYDGGHHATPAQRRSDIFRDENARDAGWRVVVLTQWDLTPRAPGMQPSAVARVRVALRERGWIPGHSRTGTTPPLRRAD